MFFPFYMVMGFLIFLGSLLSISSSSWFGIWGGFELNLLSFLPVVMHFSSFLSVESIVKYFLIQSFGSVGLLLGGLFEDSLFFTVVSAMSLLILFSLFLKIGVFPFHWWLPGVLSGFSWLGVFLLSTWQKVAPFLVFCCFCSGGAVLLFFSCFSSFLGGLMGMGQSSVRSVLAFSSISHAGWFLSMSCISSFFGSLYFFVYVVSSSFLILMLWVFDCLRLSQIFFSLPSLCLFFFISVFTVSGLPPFLGFFTKLFSFFLYSDSFLDCFFMSLLILGSLFSLYFYLGLFFSCFFSFFSFSSGTRVKSIMSFVSVFSCFSLSSVIFLDLFFSFF